MAGKLSSKGFFQDFRFPKVCKVLKVFLNFIFCKALLGIRCRQYVRNPTAALTAHALPLYYSYFTNLKNNLNLQFSEKKNAKILNIQRPTFASL